MSTPNGLVYMHAANVERTGSGIDEFGHLIAPANTMFLVEPREALPSSVFVEELFCIDVIRFLKTGSWY